MGLRRLLWAFAALPLQPLVSAQEPPYTNGTETITTSSTAAETTPEAFAKGNNYCSTKTVTETCYRTTTKCGDHCGGGGGHQSTYV